MIGTARDGLILPPEGRSRVPGMDNPYASFAVRCRNGRSVWSRLGLIPRVPFVSKALGDGILTAMERTVGSPHPMPSKTTPSVVALIHKMATQQHKRWPIYPPGSTEPHLAPAMLPEPWTEDLTARRRSSPAPDSNTAIAGDYGAVCRHHGPHAPAR